MKSIEYRITYSGKYDTSTELIWPTGNTTEQVIVAARSINSGFSKALKRAREPLGNGTRREIARIEFWGVTR